jgi:hypothetical protein
VIAINNDYGFCFGTFVQISSKSRIVVLTDVKEGGAHEPFPDALIIDLPISANHRDDCADGSITEINGHKQKSVRTINFLLRKPRTDERQSQPKLAN